MAAPPWNLCRIMLFPSATLDGDKSTERRTDESLPKVGQNMFCVPKKIPGHFVAICSTRVRCSNLGGSLLTTQKFIAFAFPSPFCFSPFSFRRRCAPVISIPNFAETINFRWWGEEDNKFPEREEEEFRNKNVSPWMQRRREIYCVCLFLFSSFENREKEEEEEEEEQIEIGSTLQGWHSKLGSKFARIKLKICLPNGFGGILKPITNLIKVQ